MVRQGVGSGREDASRRLDRLFSQAEPRRLVRRPIAGVVVARNGKNNRSAWANVLRDGMTRARKLRQSTPLYAGFSSRSQPIANPDTITSRLLTTPGGLELCDGGTDVRCMGYSLSEPGPGGFKRSRGSRQWPPSVGPLVQEPTAVSISSLFSAVVIHLEAGRWPRIPRRRKRAALRPRTTAADTFDGSRVEANVEDENRAEIELGLDTNIADAACSVHGERTMALMTDPGGVVENVYYQPLQLNKLDCQCRRRSLSRRNILDMFRPTLIATLQRDYPPPKPDDDSPNNRDVRFDSCGYCGSHYHITLRCPHAAKARCKCQQFPQLHLVSVCRVLCSRASVPAEEVPLRRLPPGPGLRLEPRVRGAAGSG